MMLIIPARAERSRPLNSTKPWTGTFTELT
jgi:hypothetical protein